ncbi:MAG: HD domain-containing phosphohydrolase [Lachnospira sp.]
MDNRERILVVDDDFMNLKAVEYILRNEFEVTCVKSGEECLSYIQETVPDMILLDLYMPNMSGFEVLERIKSDDRYKDIPVIFLTADDDKQTEVKGFQAGALDFVTKPFIAEIVRQRVNRLMELSRLQKHLEREVRRQTARAEERQHRMEQMSLQAVQTLARTIDAKDAYTNGHSYRVAEYSVLLAQELGWTEEEVENLRHAALLHDIGKISIPDSVLNKPMKLTDEEYNVIKSHASKGGEILKCITAIPGADLVARHHHERYDGAGYPDGLKGDQIPKSARIVAIVDAYDAMSSRRIYRKNLSEEIIREELVKGTGTQFEPEAAEVFIRMLDEGRLVIPESVEKLSEEGVSDDVSSQLLQQVVETMHNQTGVEECDALTGLLSRSVGEVQIAEAIQENSGCLAFFDVDNLKKINDTMGHKAGDRLLVLVGTVLSECAENSIVCRLGGDEFLLYMKEASRESAASCVEKIMKQFYQKKEEDVAVRQASLSAGLCMTTPMDVYADVYNKADKALYHVKRNGKAGYSFYRNEDQIHHNHVNVDLIQVKEALKASGDYVGALNVEYREFAKMFEYVINLQNRYHHEVHLVMITLENQVGDRLYIDELEENMAYMEMAIKETIRSIDICTRYSSVQYLVILLEAGDINVKMIVDRIFCNFYKRCGNKKMMPVYSVVRTDSEE